MCYTACKQSNFNKGNIKTMKLQIAFDLIDLENAIKIAKDIENYIDIMEVGSLLIYKYGQQAVYEFKQNFPSKIILADSKITDNAKDCVNIFAHAGADWITVMAGVIKPVIHTTCSRAHELGKKVMLDLSDSSSLEQSALEARSLGVDALLFNANSHNDTNNILSETWELIKGNTQLPIFITGQINRENISEIIQVDPDGIILGKTITQSEDPVQDIIFFSNLICPR